MLSHPGPKCAHGVSKCRKCFIELICFQTLDTDTALGEWYSVAISSNVCMVSQVEVTLALNLTAGVCLIYNLGALKNSFNFSYGVLFVLCLEHLSN